MALSGPRLKLQQVMRATLADETAKHDWTYLAVRPMPVPPTWSPGQQVRGDCSKGVQYLCKWAGAPDPMGNDFSTIGNSSTIWLHLHHVETAAELEVGDIITFGVDGSEHATMVYKAGADPMLWSFGHQGAPNSYPLSADHRVREFCKLPIIDPPPTPIQLLRAMTGFYSWLAWKQAEGPWVRFRPSAPGVRPNVPRLIAPTWWVRRARFLANRKKGDAPTTSSVT